MREILMANENLRRKIESLEAKFDGQFEAVFEAIRQLLQKENEPRKQIGFKVKSKNKTS